MFNKLTLENLPSQVNKLYQKLEELETLLLQKEGQQAKELKDEWFSLDKLVEYDPAKRVKATWYSLVSRGEVPYHKSGKHLVFLKSEIDEWLSSGKRKSNADIISIADSYLLNNKRA